MERVGIQDAHAGLAVLRRAHPVQGALHVYAWQASIEKQAALWAKSYLPQWASLIQQSLDWMSKDHDEETDDEADLSETVRFVHDVAGRITGTRDGAPEASG